jgi:hypothetical protein
MRDAATVLEIIRERGRRGLPLERVYRCLFNPDLYLPNHDECWRASCYGKRARLVRRGAVEKGPGQPAPRRRPTLHHVRFGPEAAGKGPAWPGTSPAAYRYTLKILNGYRHALVAPHGNGSVAAVAPRWARMSAITVSAVRSR